MADSYLKILKSKVKNPNLRNYLSYIYSPGTPVNAVASQATFTLSGVVIDGETVTIDGDIYEFCTDAAQSVTTAGNIAVDIESGATKSQGTLTMDTNPTANDTMTIGTTVYTFKAVASAAGDIAIGVDVAATQLNTVAAVNGTDAINTAHESVSMAAFAANDAVITALVGGTAGDAIATTETFTAGTNVFDAATLGTTTAGIDCTAANADGPLVSADVGTTYSLAQGTGTTVVATAATKGTAGDALACTETCANGAWDAATFGTTTAGVNGTVGTAGMMKYDATYLYHLDADNSISGANWRRIARGAVY